MAIKLKVISSAGAEASLTVQKILSIDGVAFEASGASGGPSLQNIEDRLRLLERFLGELSFQLPQVQELSPVESHSPLAGQSQPDLQQPTLEEPLEVKSSESPG